MVFMCGLNQPMQMSAASDVGWGFFAFGLVFLLCRIVYLVRSGHMFLDEVEVFPVVAWCVVWLGMGMAILITNSAILDNPCPGKCHRIDLHDGNIAANKAFGGIFIALGIIFLCCCTFDMPPTNWNLLLLASWDYLLLLIGICLVAVAGSLGSCPASCPLSTPAPKVAAMMLAAMDVPVLK